MTANIDSIFIYVISAKVRELLKPCGEAKFRTEKKMINSNITNAIATVLLDYHQEQANIKITAERRVTRSNSKGYTTNLRSNRHSTLDDEDDLQTNVPDVKSTKKRNRIDSDDSESEALVIDENADIKSTFDDLDADPGYKPQKENDEKEDDEEEDDEVEEYQNENVVQEEEELQDVQNYEDRESDEPDEPDEVIEVEEDEEAEQTEQTEEDEEAEQTEQTEEDEEAGEQNKVGESSEEEHQEPVTSDDEENSDEHIEHSEVEQNIQGDGEDDDNVDAEEEEQYDDMMNQDLEQIKKQVMNYNQSDSDN